MHSLTQQIFENLILPDIWVGIRHNPIRLTRQRKLPLAWILCPSRMNQNTKKQVSTVILYSDTSHEDKQVDELGGDSEGM